MDLVTRNVLKHVYDAILSRKRMADNGNISNLQLFYNRLISEYCASDKKGQCLVVPLTGQDVDDFYSRKMKRDQFVEIVRTKVIAKVAHFDAAVLHKLCWECFSGSHDAQLIQMLTLISPSSATLLWLIFCKLDTDGKLKLHPEDVVELIVRLLTHLRVNPDRKTVEAWLGDQMGSLAAWVSFWPFFILTVEKCLAPRGAQATSRAVQALYEEIVDEVMKKAQMIKKGHVRHTWKMRWFVLASTDLIYYETKESLVKKGSVVLNERARVEVMMDKNEKDTRYPNRFKVVDGISNQFTEISADSPSQMNEWVDAINMAIKLSSITDGRNYVHRLQLVQRGDNVSDSQSSSVKSPVMQSFSAQPSSLPSMDDVSELSSGSSSGGNNKISRKISLPVLNTSPPLTVESRETVSANSSQTDLYSVVDRKKKVSAPSIPPPVSTRPIRKHDYEDIDGKELPPFLPQYHATPPTSTRPFRKHEYEDIPDKDLPPPPPHHHADVKPNSHGPPKIPAPYHSNSSNIELKASSAKKMADLHSNSFDTSTDPLGTRDDEVIRRLKPTQSADGPSKRHSSIMDEEDFNRTYSTISDDKPDIRRSHTPDIGSLHAMSVDKKGGGTAPEIPERRKLSPPTVPRRGSPLAQRRQLAIDPPTPPLPPKKQPPVEYSQPQVEYSEVPANRPTALGMANGFAGFIVNDSKDSSYADLDFSQLPTPTGGSSAPPPVDHSKRDYADIDFAITQQLEKSILQDDGANTSHVKLPPKLPSKNMGSVEDKSGYVKVDFPKSNGEDRSGQPRQMMVIQPQARVPPAPMKTVSADAPPSRPKPTPRTQNSAPSIPPHHSKNPPPLPPKQTLY